MNINKTYVAIGAAALGGLAVGAGAGYFVTKKVLKKKYQESLDKTIEGYESEIKKLKCDAEPATIEATSEEATVKTEETPEKTEEKSTDDDEESDGSSPRIINYSKFSSNIKTPDMPKELKEGVISIIGNDDDVLSEAEKFVNKVVAADEYPEHNPDGIIKQPNPYCISIDEFGEAQRPWYDHKELILFMKDYIYINGEKVSTPILYSCDDDAIVDVFVSEEVSKKLEAAGLVKTGIWQFDNLDMDLDEFGKGFDYKSYELAKRCDNTEMECYVDKRDDKSYADDMLGIENVDENNYRNVYRELWEKPAKE